MQKSIDLQDYLNYSTGLDYKKLPSSTNPQVSQRKQGQQKEGGSQKTVVSLVDKINKNRFITDNDFERQKQEEQERSRKDKLRRLDEELTSQTIS